MLNTPEIDQHHWVAWAFSFPLQNSLSQMAKLELLLALGCMTKIKKSLANNVNHNAHTVLLWLLTLAKKNFPFFFSVYKIGLNPTSIKSCQTYSTKIQVLVLSQNGWFITFSLALLMWEENTTAKWKSEFATIRKHSENCDHMPIQKYFQV